MKESEPAWIAKDRSFKYYHTANWLTQQVTREASPSKLSKAREFQM